ncbi:hypothetical protein LMG23994_00790 [Cupriavidus pinatubonensis]|uniref:Lipoprotein n=1 Tax=Cupriavidus pinatubonensis TaxID=248026 RepID=A0ABN7XX35_9BURK|nr:hypothetical protein LMG23994_00790 [Cupriavidus pinatubonensis]
MMGRYVFALLLALQAWKANAQLIVYPAPAMTVADCPAGKIWIMKNNLPTCDYPAPPPPPPPPPLPPGPTCPDPMSTLSFAEIDLIADQSDNGGPPFWLAYVWYMGATKGSWTDGQYVDPLASLDAGIRRAGFIPGAVFLNFSGVQYRQAVCAP